MYSVTCTWVIQDILASLKDSCTVNLYTQLKLTSQIQAIGLPLPSVSIRLQVCGNHDRLNMERVLTPEMGRCSSMVPPYDGVKDIFTRGSWVIWHLANPIPHCFPGTRGWIISNVRRNTKTFSDFLRERHTLFHLNSSTQRIWWMPLLLLPVNWVKRAKLLWNEGLF